MSDQTEQPIGAPADNLKINGDRLWNSLMEMAKVGPGVRGGNNRQALTDEDGEGRRLFQTWCEAEGLDMSVDQMGNMFAQRQGQDSSLPPVYVGSHLDTQPTGGKFDGVLGVLAGLEIIRILNEYDIKTRHPIVVTNWTNEEGTRFAPAMAGSGVFVGALSLDNAYARQDADGKTLGEELARTGWKGSEPVGARNIKSYFELHIEQGPILEAQGNDIGVVTHGQGVRWVQCTITGFERHTGSTPMKMRQNAGLGLARITELVHEIAMARQPNAVGAIGHIDVYPNSRNVIPGKVICTIDFRSHELDTLKSMVEELMAKAPRICEEIGVAFEAEIVSSFDPPAFGETCVKAVRSAAKSLGYKYQDIISGAGHDACWINSVAPAAMVMCPCVDGLSHNEDEDITPEWAAAGANVLFHAVVETAEIVS